VTPLATALLFPGQGSQRVGMGQDLYASSSAARRVFDLADEVCARPLARLCFDGPEDELRRTDVAQPALVAVELAALAALAEVAGLGDDPTAALEPLGARWTAGHSLGEYAASVAAGALSLENGLRLAAERGRLMAEAPPGTMVAVLGLDADVLRPICARADGVVVVANDNAPGQVVLSGQTAAVRRASEAAQAAGARRVLALSAGGAFHSPLMAEAARAFAAALDGVALRDPCIPILGNVSARPIESAAALRAELAEQIASPVRWREGLDWLAVAGAERLIECGPGNVLAGMARRSVPTLAARGLASWDEVRTLAAELGPA
jgi:[acyl-carrier-protein] S-malonyltransferase